MMKESKKNRYHGFKVPDAYFKAFEFKNDFKKQSHGFQIPENYFNQFKVSNQIKKDKYAKVFRLIKHSKITYVVGMAASLLIMFAIINSQPKTNSLENYDIALLESYLLEESIYSSDISSLVDDTVTLYELEFNNYNNINDKEVENFLLYESEVEELILN